MVKLAMVKGVIKKYEIFFKSQQWKNIGRLSIEDQGMRKVVTNLKAKIVEKDNKINDLQASVDSFKLKIFDRDEEIIKKDKDIVQITWTL